MEENKNIYLIYLDNGKFAIVDLEDFMKFSKYKWYTNPEGYAVRQQLAEEGNCRGTRYMAREIMNAPKKLKVDHKNMNKLDNRKSNLRICTDAQNIRNRWKVKKNPTSKYKGVYLSRKDKYAKWRAGIGFNYDFIFLGDFNNEIDAARAYDKKAKELHGEFARLNFPNI